MTLRRVVEKCGRRLGLCVLPCMCLGCDPSDSIRVHADFESAAAEQVSIDANHDIHFSMPPDPVGNERLWFHFRVSSSEPVRPWFILENSSDAGQGNWDVVRPILSANGRDWVRAQDAGYESSLLSRFLARAPVFRFRSPFRSREIWVAYSYPYATARLRQFLGTLLADDRVRAFPLGLSEEGREIQRITIEESHAVAGARMQDIWIIGREHPGETPASFVLEGVIDALLHRPVGRTLLARYRVNVVPMLNVDGVVRGHYYRNSRGVDLAQDWGTFRSAEVRALHEAMREGLAAGRVALVLDLHSANDQKGHFFLETPETRLTPALLDIQRRLLDAARGAHAQLQVATTVKLWEDPGIAGNYLAANYGVYCFYSESNYSAGADGTVVTTDTLRGLGEALVHVLAEALVPRS